MQFFYGGEMGDERKRLETLLGRTAGGAAGKKQGPELSVPPPPGSGGGCCYGSFFDFVPQHRLLLGHPEQPPPQEQLCFPARWSFHSFRQDPANSAATSSATTMVDRLAVKKSSIPVPSCHTVSYLFLRTSIYTRNTRAARPATVPMPKPTSPRNSPPS